ncbi:sugar ABC transporter substrate-binding protein [Devosia sp. A369]
MFLRQRRLFLAGATALATLVGAGTIPMVGAYAQASGEPVTLVIANSQWVDALRGANLWNAMLKYQEVAPNVTLVQEAIPSAEIADKLTTEMGAGQGPDIAIIQEGLFYSLADAGFLVDIDKAAEGVALNTTNANGLVDGKRLGLAWQRAAYALIYNRPLADAGKAEVPTDVDSLIASAQAVNAATGAVGFTARHQMADYTNWFMDFQNWAYGYGTNWVDGSGKLTVNTPEAVAAVTAFKKVYDANVLPIGDSMPTMRTRFKELGVGYSFDNSGGTLNIVSGGALAKSDLYAAKLPFVNPGAHQQIFLAVSTHSKQQEAATAFIAWVVSPEGQIALREASGPDALATDVPLTEAFRAENPWADTFAEVAPASRSTLIPGYEVETAQIMRFVMEAIERVLVANEDPQAALDAAQIEVDEQSF